MREYAIGAILLDLDEPEHLIAALPTWGLLGNGILLALCWIVVIPAPWALVRLYTYVAITSRCRTGGN